MSSLFLTSVTRISDMADSPWQSEALGFDQWEDGDYTLAEVVGEPNIYYRVELSSGRTVQTFPGDRVVGALGHRAATLEAVGSWRAVGADRAMHALTGAGLFGRCTSLAPFFMPPMSLRYLGHVQRNGRKLRMSDFAVQSAPVTLRAPVVLLVGTSMSAGKTTAGRLVVHELASRGLKVIAGKLTGAGRFRDVLSFRDAGAAHVFDFVDAGLASTVVPEHKYLEAIRPLISRIAALGPDVVVVEAGASPLEPYNGAGAIDEVANQVRCTCLCASDPYSVVGVTTAFGLKPDLVTGPATNTTAGIELVEKLTGIEAINVFSPNARRDLGMVLERCLSLTA